jgi:hypothetical protein
LCPCAFFALYREAFSFYDPGIEDWAVEAGDCEVPIGRFSGDMQLRMRSIFFIHAPQIRHLFMKWCAKAIGQSAKYFPRNNFALVHL